MYTLDYTCACTEHFNINYVITKSAFDLLVVTYIDQ